MSTTDDRPNTNDATAVIDGWRRANAREYVSQGRPQPAGLWQARAATPAQVKALRRATDNDYLGFCDPKDLRRAVSRQALPSAPSSGGTSPSRPGVKAAVKRVVQERAHLESVAAERARLLDATGVVERARRLKLQRTIAASPARLRLKFQRESAAIDAAESRERRFDLTTHVVRQDQRVDTITPRHVKATYIGTLQAAEKMGRVSPRWVREHTKASTRRLYGGELPPIDATQMDLDTINTELQSRAAVKASRKGLPSVEGFTELSEAISAVVVAAKAGRTKPPPTPLCGDSMTYWDRVNFFNRFQESCTGGNEQDLRSTIPKLKRLR
jgi:hypothetical protein